MTRRFTLIALLIACVFSLTVSRAPAAEDVLKLLPDGAWGLLVINHPAVVDAKAQTVARQSQFPAPSLLAMLKQLGMAGGFDEKGTVALLALPPQGDNPLPTGILLVPVSDYGKFIGQFQPESSTAAVTKITLMGRPAWTRNIGGYAALTDESHRPALENTLKVSQEIPAPLASWQKWLGQNDIAAVVLSPGLKRLSAKAQEGIQRMKASLEHIKKSGEMAEQFKTAAAVFDMYAKFFQAAEKEVTAYGLGLQVDQRGVLRVVSRTTLAPGGEWAGLVGKIPSAKGNLLAGLPAEPFVVAAGGALSKAMMDAMLKSSVNLMKSMRSVYGLSDAQVEKMTKFRQQAMKQGRAFSIVLGVGKDREPIFSGVVGVMRVEHTAAFMADYEKDFQQNADFFKSVNSPLLPKPEVEKSEVGGIAALKITTTLPVAVQGKRMPEATKIMEAYFGAGEKMVAWVVPADEQRVVLGYVSKQRLEQAVEAIKKGTPGLAGDAGVAKTVALLPSGASAIALLSPEGAIDFVQRILPAFMPPQAKLELKLPAFGKTVPVGFAVMAGKDELRTCTVVPGEVMQAVGQYVGKLRAAHGGAAK